MSWTQQEAIELCRKIEAICPPHGFHVALTGGLLYRDGERKDCDLVLYRIGQVEEPDFCGLIYSLYELGFDHDSFELFGFCTKCCYRGKSVDILMPEVNEGHYFKRTGEPLQDAVRLVVNTCQK